MRFEGGALDQLARAGITPQQIIDYGAFSWAVLSPNALQTLEDAAISYEFIADAYTLNLGGQSFDPLTQQPAFEPAWAPRDTYPPSPDLQLVQLAGPVKAEWIDDLQANGLEIVQYIHPFTYVVWGTPVELVRASQNISVRWTGAFAPAFRVQPQNRILAASSIPVHILLYLGADTQSLIKQIVSLGGIFQGSSVMDATFEVAAFELDEALFADVAALPGVYSIQPVPTDGGLRGEMSNQINAGNVGADNLAYTGYLDWLAAIGLSGQGVTSPTWTVGWITIIRIWSITCCPVWVHPAPGQPRAIMVPIQLASWPGMALQV